MTSLAPQYIESISGKCGGKPCIAGTRIRVWDIYVASELRGQTPDEIVADYPGLGLAQIHAALAFYWENREAIDQQMKQADDYAKAAQALTGVSPLVKRLSSGLNPSGMLDSESQSVPKVDNDSVSS